SCLTCLLTSLLRCGECAGCHSQECGVCKHCQDMPKNGGPGRIRQA
ncbi:unnamed protein product, partial [Laminaria digitata]